MSRLTYTKAIRAGRLKATEMEVGSSVVGVLKDFKPGKFGSNIVVEVQGKDVEIFPAGNMKFLEKDVAEGKRSFDLVTTITRLPDIQKNIQGTVRNVTQFEITQAAPAASTATASAPVAQTSIKEKLDAIRANRTNA